MFLCLNLTELQDGGDTSDQRSSTSEDLLNLFLIRGHRACLCCTDSGDWSVGVRWAQVVADVWKQLLVLFSTGSETETDADTSSSAFWADHVSPRPPSSLISLLLACAGSLLRLPAAINNVSSHLDETANNKHLRAETAARRREATRRRGDNCEAPFICFYSSVVFSAAVCNQHASEHGGQTEGWGTDRRTEGGRTEEGGGSEEEGGGGCSCCLASFCFLTDTTKSSRRGKTVVFVCRHRAKLPAPTERGWMEELLRQQTHHPSVCQRERERSERRREEEEEERGRQRDWAGKQTSHRRPRPLRRRATTNDFTTKTQTRRKVYVWFKYDVKNFLRVHRKLLFYLQERSETEQLLLWI